MYKFSYLLKWVKAYNVLTKCLRNEESTTTNQTDPDLDQWRPCQCPVTDYPDQQSCEEQSHLIYVKMGSWFLILTYS